MSTDDFETGTCLYKKEYDILQRFFTRPLFLSSTIGIPFCIFKLLFGIALVRIGTGTSVLLYEGGWMVTGWALADLTMNLGRVFFDFLNRPAPFEYCTIAQIGRFFSMPMVFLAFDTLVTFVIICTMLWSGWITMLTAQETFLWYAATTMNLISLSFVVLYNEVRRLQ